MHTSAQKYIQVIFVCSQYDTFHCKVQFSIPMLYVLEQSPTNLAHTVNVNRGRDQLPSDLIFPVVLLRMPQHTVAEPQHVLVGSISLVPQIFESQHRAFSCFLLKGCFKNPKHLPGNKAKGKPPILMNEDRCFAMCFNFF